jgi:hypothetical protein
MPPIAMPASRAKSTTSSREMVAMCSRIQFMVCLS